MNYSCAEARLSAEEITEIYRNMEARGLHRVQDDGWPAGCQDQGKAESDLPPALRNEAEHPKADRACVCGVIVAGGLMTASMVCGTPSHSEHPNDARAEQIKDWNKTRSEAQEHQSMSAIVIENETGKLNWRL